MINWDLMRPGNFILIGAIAVVTLWLAKPLMHTVEMKGQNS